MHRSAERSSYDGLGNLRIASRQHLAGIPPRTSSQNAPVTGLDYFGARYFSAAQGRFTTPDPLMASAKASNPQTWNRYA
jgi:RHS repeat-associated protein